MLGKFINKAYSKVRDKADDIRQQVAQQASKAGEALGIYKSYSESGLQAYLINQANQANSISSLEELCKKWISQIKASKGPRYARHIADPQIEENKADTTGHGSSEGSEVLHALQHVLLDPFLKDDTASNKRNNPASSLVGEEDSTKHDLLKTTITVSTDTVNASESHQVNLSSAADVPLSAEASAYARTRSDSSPSRNIGADSQATVLKASAAGSEEMGVVRTATMDSPSNKSKTESLPVRYLAGNLHVEEDSSMNAQLDLSFKQVLLKSSALEVLLRNVFGITEIRKSLTANESALEEDLPSAFDTAAGGNSRSCYKRLLQLLECCLWGDRSLHTDLLNIFITVEPSWNILFGFLIQLVHFMKFDWEDSYLRDKRRLISHEIKGIQSAIQDETALLRHQTNQPQVEHIAMHGNRVLNARKAISYYKKLQMNYNEAASRRKVWLLRTSEKIAQLKSELLSLKKVFESDISGTSDRKRELQIELLSCSEKLSGLLSESKIRHQKVESRLQELKEERATVLKTLSMLENEIEELEAKRNTILNENINIHGDLNSLQVDFETRVTHEESMQKMISQQKIETYRISEVANRFNEFVELTPKLNVDNFLKNTDILNAFTLKQCRLYVVCQLDRIQHQRATLSAHYGSFIKLETEYRQRKLKAGKGSQKLRVNSASSSLSMKEGASPPLHDSHEEIASEVSPAVASGGQARAVVQGVDDYYSQGVGAEQISLEHEPGSSNDTRVNNEKLGVKTKHNERLVFLQYNLMLSRKKFLQALDHLDAIWREFCSYKENLLPYLELENSQPSSLGSDIFSLADDVKIATEADEKFQAISPDATSCGDTQVVGISGEKSKAADGEIDATVEKDILTNLQVRPQLGLFFADTDSMGNHSLHELIELFEGNYQAIRRSVAPWLEEISELTPRTSSKILSGIKENFETSQDDNHEDDIFVKPEDPVFTESGTLSIGLEGSSISADDLSTRDDKDKRIFSLESEDSLANLGR